MQVKSIGNSEKQFTSDLQFIVSKAREYSYRAANIMQVISNWLIGWRIVEQEQHGKERAEYGKHIIEIASAVLTAEYGKGYSETALRSFRLFYLTFNDLQIQQTLPTEFKEHLHQIQQTLSANLDKDADETIKMPDIFTPNVNGQVLLMNLSWSHYERLIRVADSNVRQWYMREAASQQWDYRTLKRNIDSQYYHRLLQTPEANRPTVVDEMQQLNADYQAEKCEFIKNPMLVEFLGFQQDATFTENNLETAIISHLQRFLMEMGKGYAFVARQQHIHTQDDDYYVDLVFYNYLLKCFVLIDLKTTKVSYQDVGQMEMYLKMYDQLKKTEQDNPTIGIILCSETNADVAQYSTLATNPQMYAAKYLTYMPTQEELRREIEQQKAIFELKQGAETKDTVDNSENRS